MDFPIRQSTSTVIPLGFFLSKTDGDTEQTSLTLANTDLWVWKAGATSLVSKNSGGATHMQNGVFYATLDTTDTNTVGPFAIYIHKSGALVCVFRGVVLRPSVYDALYGSSAAYLPVDLLRVGGSTFTLETGLAKTGDAMELIPEYDAAKVAASATLVGQVKTVTDILNGMISSGAWLSSVYANMPTVVGPGSRPVAIGPIYKAGTTTPISGVEATVYTEATLTSLPIDRKWSDLLGYAHTYLNPGTYYVTLVRSDEIFSGNPYTIVVPEA